MNDPHSSQLWMFNDCIFKKITYGPRVNKAESEYVHLTSLCSDMLVDVVQFVVMCGAAAVGRPGARHEGATTVVC